jgi:hypothetical protein
VSAIRKRGVNVPQVNCWLLLLLIMILTLNMNVVYRDDQGVDLFVLQRGRRCDVILEVVDVVVDLLEVVVGQGFWLVI